MPALDLSMEYIALIPFLAQPDAILARRNMGAQMAESERFKQRS
jgi:hypothetical protein